MACFEKLNVFSAGYEADVRQAADEAARVARQPLFGKIGPQLQGEHEFFVDGGGAGNVYAAVCLLRGVVEFAQGGVPRAGVVAFVGAFQRGGIEPLKYGDAFFRCKLFEKRAERCAHDACADKGDMGTGRGGGELHGFVPSCAVWFWTAEL